MKPKENKKCRTEGCKRPYRAKGYCVTHYKKWRQGELPHRRYKTCHAEGCLKPIALRGLCGEHAGIKKEEATPAAAAPVAAPEAAPAAEAPAEGTPSA